MAVKVVAATPERRVEIPAIRRETLRLTIEGDNLLCLHKFSDKAKKAILDKQTRVASGGKAARDTEQEYRDAIPYCADGKTAGIPAIAVKKAMVGACRYVDKNTLNMTFARGAFFVNGDMLAIRGDGPHMREDVVRIGRGTQKVPMFTYRPYFHPGWQIDLTITFNPEVISAAQVVNLLNIAGYSGGLGENRPEKSGNCWGQFHVGKNGHGP